MKLPKLIKLFEISFLFNLFFLSSCIPFFPDPSDKTKEDIIAKWEQYKPTYEGNPFVGTPPSTSAPYSIGELNDYFVQDGLNMANFVRYLAGLPENLTIDEDLSIQAQYGAVLLAASNFSHYPNQPSDMPNDFYNIGYASTSSSNLSAGLPWLWQTIIDGYIRDDDMENLPKVGHRRWLFNPSLRKTAFGFAENYSSEYIYYSTMQVKDDSGFPIDYDYISWPCKGYFPKEFFDSNDPWTITLNPSKYESPSISNITVILRREDDGMSWTLDISDNYVSSNNEYFNIDKGGNLIKDCIIFRPKVSDVDKYHDPDIYGNKYEVTVTGLNKIGGIPTEINYEVEFFYIGIDRKMPLENKPFKIDTENR
jgi:uncharacterized protein YkwD